MRWTITARRDLWKSAAHRRRPPRTAVCPVLDVEARKSVQALDNEIRA